MNKTEPFLAGCAPRFTLLRAAPSRQPRRRSGAFCLALLFLTSAVGAAGLPEPAGQRLIEPFDYHGVRLDPGPLRAQVDEVREFYLAIPDDDLLKGFRARAGLPAPGRDLGGWYSSDTFLVFGQIVSGLARLYAGTGDERCRDKANHLVAEWSRCLAPDGYFYASRKPNAPHYIYDKMLWGLVDDYLYCGNREALAALSRITDWAIAHLERSRRINDTSTEWYTLSENLYRAYLATGDAKYRIFAEVWEYHEYWDSYVRGGDIFAARPDGGRTGAYHAYSHVNNLGGAGAAYLVSGDRALLDTLIHASDFLQRQQCFATGGFGPDEQLLPGSALRDRWSETHNTFETQCGCWAAFKLEKYLLSFTGMAQYGDWVERLVINGLGASIPMTTNGCVFYYSDYCLYGGAKRNTDFGWSCCTGTRPQAVADYHDLIFFHDAQNLYVNLFTPSTVAWPRPEGVVTVSQSTRFPEGEQVRLTVTVHAPTEFGLVFRIPVWLAQPMRATVNGRETALATATNGWATLRRRWEKGDEVGLQLPMKLWASPLGAERPAPTAVLFGPTVLAFSAPNARSLRGIDVSTPDRELKPVEGRPLHFSVASQRGVEVRPFYDFKAGEEYFVYLTPNLGSRIPHSRVKFTGGWQNSGLFRFSNEVGATAEGEFEGPGVRWLGRRFDDAGRAEITIDGKVIGVIDQFGPGRDLPFDWTQKELGPGRHTIRLRLLEEKPQGSKDRYLNVMGFEELGR